VSTDIERRTALSKLIALGSLFAVGVRAQPTPQGQPPAKVARIGVVLFSTPQTEPNFTAFVAGLRDLGYVEGRNIAFEHRYAEGHPERFRDIALQTVASNPDVIVVLGGDMVPFVKDATYTIPVVMLTSNDPVEARVISSFARPGGNMTGVAFVSSETAAKRLQILKEAVPALARAAVLWNPEHPDGEFRDIESAGRRLGVHIESLEVRRPEDLETAFQAAVRARADALIVVSSRLMNQNRARILGFADKHRIPLVSGWGAWVTAGGLMSYGPDLDVLSRRAATHVDKILKGAKPSELAVEQPNKFELVVNLKTARLFGLKLPGSVLVRADRVIE
jgi:putative ABC transport system substrate-binding protein